MINPIFFGTIKNSRINLENKMGFIKYISKFEDREIQIIIDLKRKGRSLDENSYYWAVPVRMLADEMGLLDGQIHEMLKLMFLKVGFTYKGKRYEVARSTTQLSTREFEDYMERIRMWAGQELGCYIPLPGEVSISV